MAATINGVSPTPAQKRQLVDAFSLAPDFAAFSKPLTFGFAGDSIAGYWQSALGDSPLSWVRYGSYPCDIRRIFNSSVGGVSSSHLISTQIAQLEALTTMPDVLVVQTLQNDFMNSTASADVFLAYVTEYVTRALAAGVAQVWVCSRPPKNETSAGVPDAITYANRKIAEFCRNTPGAVYIDVFNLWRDVSLSNASTRITFRGTAGTDGSYSDDGVHPTPLAMSKVGELILPLLQRIARPITPLPVSLNAYDNSTAIWNNILGPNGMMQGTLGQLNGVDNANVAGTAANNANRWRITTNNGVTAVPSIVTGADGYLYQQIVLGGTATADATITLQITPATNVVLGQFVSEAIVECEALSQVRSIIFGGSFGFLLGLGSAVTTQSEIPSGTTNRYHFRSDPYGLNITNYAGNNHTLTISVSNGRSPTGTVRLGRVSTCRIRVT